MSKRPRVADWIDEVAKLDVKPGDTIVIRVARQITVEEAHLLQSQALQALPDVRVLVLPPELTIEVET
jgi:hypothetical protein